MFQQLNPSLFFVIAVINEFKPTNSSTPKFHAAEFFSGIEFTADLVGSFQKTIFDVLPFPGKTVYRLHRVRSLRRRRALQLRRAPPFGFQVCLYVVPSELRSLLCLLLHGSVLRSSTFFPPQGPRFYVAFVQLPLLLGPSPSSRSSLCRGFQAFQGQDVFFK